MGCPTTSPGLHHHEVPPNTPLLWVPSTTGSPHSTPRFPSPRGAPQHPTSVGPHHAGEPRSTPILRPPRTSLFSCRAAEPGPTRRNAAPSPAPLRVPPARDARGRPTPPRSRQLRRGPSAGPERRPRPAALTVLPPPAAPASPSPRVRAGRGAAAQRGAARGPAAVGRSPAGRAGSGAGAGRGGGREPFSFPSQRDPSRALGCFSSALP